jgi:osmotically-inducible protein OsmY
MHSATIDRPKAVNPERINLSAAAKSYLESHPHFRGRVNDVSIMHEDKTLYLTGRLPTFYLKQLVQEAVRHVPGVQYVRNMIDVVNAEGISSVRC